MERNLEVILDGVLRGDSASVEAHIEDALRGGLAPSSILNRSLIAAMAEVGARFERGEMFVPEMLMAAHAMKAGLAILKPHLAASGIHATGKIVLGTVSGDLHDIGKNLVGMMLEGAGFEVVDLGIDVAPERFVQAVQESGAQLVGVSALLTTTMYNMSAVILALTEAGLRDKVKVMVGGAPLDEAFARRIGADGYGPDASRRRKVGSGARRQLADSRGIVSARVRQTFSAQAGYPDRTRRSGRKPRPIGARRPGRCAASRSHLCGLMAPWLRRSGLDLFPS
jgi:5-methyltetrahydrofolate--homocysteine methyltransferase